MTRLTIVLAVLGAGLLALILNHESGMTLGIDNDRFGHLVTLLPIALMLAYGIVASRHRLGESLRNLLIWVVIILVLAAVYVYRDDARMAGGRLIAALVPGYGATVVNADGQTEVVLYKSNGAHFQVTAAVNGQEIEMLVDTGASTVALSREDAERAGFNPDNLLYTTRVMTANGEARAAPVRLTTLSIGPIMRRNVEANVAEDGKLDQSLLGMSFLGTLSSLQMQTDELRLRD